MIILSAQSVGYKLVNDYTVCSKWGLQASERSYRLLKVGYKLVNDYTVCSKCRLQVIPSALSVGYKLVNDYTVCSKCGLQASE